MCQPSEHKKGGASPRSENGIMAEANDRDASYKLVAGRDCDCPSRSGEIF